jgi:hypothetical protein
MENGEAVLTFNEDWSVEQSGALVAGTRVRVRYALRRLLGGSDVGSAGQHSFNLNGFCRFDDGPAHCFDLGGRRPSEQRYTESVIELPTYARHLELWFERTGLYGSSRYDSDYGHNFSFKVYPALDVSGAVRRYVSELSRSP